MSFFMTFGACLVVCGVLLWRAGRKVAAIFFYTVAVAGTALYSYKICTATIPVPQDIAVHLAANLSAGLIIFFVQWILLRGARPYVFPSRVSPGATASRVASDGLCVGLLTVFAAVLFSHPLQYLLPFMYIWLHTQQKEIAEAVSSILGTFEIPLRALVWFPIGFIAGAALSIRKGGSKGVRVK